MSMIGDAHLRKGQAMMASARFQSFLGDERTAEQQARGALSEFASAMNYLEDTPDFEIAHFRIDEAGQWIRESFGCSLSRTDSGYARTCPADLAHLRVGLSPGMKNVVRVCGVCGQEPTTCRHIRGRSYTTSRRLIGGLCNLCGTEDCRHSDDDFGEVVCAHRLTSFDIDEISMVARPAGHGARFQSIPVDEDKLASHLGPPWKPGMEVSCDKCLTPCTGVTEFGPRFSHGGAQILPMRRNGPSY